jgi:GntR family transcriptional regulator
MPFTFPIHISKRDDAPIYRQIASQLTGAVAAGRLESGGQLPSLRALAKDLVVSPLTVKKAYDVLESQGLIESRQGHGTFVRTDITRNPEQAPARLNSLIQRLASEAEVAGVEARELQALLEQAMGALRKEREGIASRSSPEA